MRVYLFLGIVAALLQGCSPMTAVIGFGSAGAPAPAAVDVASRAIGRTVSSDILAEEMLEEVNEFRTRHQLPALSTDPVATQAADWMSRYQADKGTMTHRTTVAGMETFDSRYKNLGGDRVVAGAENIAWHQLRMRNGQIVESYEELADRIVGGWIDSPEHRRNLLLSSPRGQAVAGFGVATGRNQSADGVYSTLSIFYVHPTQTATGS